MPKNTAKKAVVETPEVTTIAMTIESLYERFSDGFNKWSKDQKEASLGFAGNFLQIDAIDSTVTVENKNAIDSLFFGKGLPKRYTNDSFLHVVRFAEGAITFKLHTQKNNKKTWINEIEFWFESADLFGRLDAVNAGNRLHVGEQKFVRTKGNMKSTILTSEGHKFNGKIFTSHTVNESIVFEQLMGKLDKWEVIPAHAIKR